MASFFGVYVFADPTREDALLQRTLELAGKLVGSHHVRLRRGSGWLQLQPFDKGLPPAIEAELSNFVEMDLDARINKLESVLGRLRKRISLVESARILSREFVAETISIESHTTVDAVEYSHWESGKLRRHISYCLQDYENNRGWSIDVGKPESWEKDLTDNDAGPDAWDIGRAFKLPGFGPEARDLSMKFWDVEEVVVGDSGSAD